MSSFEKHRFRIFTMVQHPLKHSLDDFSYTNPGLGDQVSTVQQAMDWIFAVLYPQSKTAVDTPGDLPLVGNSLNDFRVVNDDGDGKAAAYRWEQREGEASPSWHKIYDMDWGVDSILQQMYLKTQDIYASKIGYNDIDGTGTPVTGVLAGQSIYGGATANTNLTLFANSGDGAGPITGFVQFGNQVRPTADNTFDFGTTTERWQQLWAYSAQLGTANISSGSYTDSSGTIDFGSTDLETTGTLTAGGLSIASVTLGTLSLSSGSITDTSGDISFGTTNLSTSGTLDSGVLTVSHNGETLEIDPDFTGQVRIAGSQNLHFTNNIYADGFIECGDITSTKLNADNLTLDGNTLSVTNLNGNLVVLANGTGVIDLQSAMTTIGQTVTGTLSVTGQLNADNLRLDANVLSSTNSNGNITLTPNGTGRTQFSSSVFPANTGTQDIGDSTHLWQNLWISGSIGGTNAVAVSVLESLRDINVGVGLNYTIFYDGTKWVSSAPDSEISHSSLSNLTTSDDHSQYLYLAGRSGGQSVNGGSASGNSLTLDSTAHATKGSIFFKSNASPFADAVYSGGWTGTDIGDNSHHWNNVYTSGEFLGFRLENISSDFTSSATTVGRLAFNTTSKLIILDNGTSVVAVGAQHSETDTSWNGSDITKTVSVTGVADARKAIWVLKDNTNNFEQMFVKLTATNATTVVIDVTVPLPAGTYRLIGLQ